MRIYGPFYKFTRSLFRLVGKKYRFEGVEDAPSPAVFVIHHHNMKGPIYTLGWIPREVRMWTLGVFFEFKTAYLQYFDYTLTEKLGMWRPLAAVIAFLAALVVPPLFRSGGFIPVYRKERRIIETLKNTVEALEKGESVAISPDVDYLSEEGDIGEIYNGFLNIEKYYYRKTKKHVPFVPLRIDHQNRVGYAQRPVCFEDGVFADQKEKVGKLIRRRLQQFGEEEGGKKGGAL